MNEPSFSIVVPVYNREEHLDGCVQSVTAQTYPNWELWLVDDGSDDKSVELARAWQTRDPRVHAITRPPERPKGANACRNLGAELATGRYILFLDSDDELLPDALRFYVSSFTDGEALAAVVTNARFAGNNGELFNKCSQISEYDFWEAFITKRFRMHIDAVAWSRAELPPTPFNEELQAGQDFAFHLQQSARSGINRIEFTDEVTAVIKRDNPSISRAPGGKKFQQYLLARLVSLPHFPDRADVRRQLLASAEWYYWKAAESGTPDPGRILLTYRQAYEKEFGAQPDRFRAWCHQHGGGAGGFVNKLRYLAGRSKHHFLTWTERIIKN